MLLTIEEVRKLSRALKENGFIDAGIDVLNRIADNNTVIIPKRYIEKAGMQNYNFIYN